MPGITLRDYQIRAIEMTRPVINDRPLIVIPTGGGKTIVACRMIESAVSRGWRVLFLVHREELMHQAVARLARFGIEAGTIQASRPRIESPVQVAMVQTLASWYRKPNAEIVPARLVIIDEAHHVADRAKRKKDDPLSSYLTVLDKYRDAKVIGLTATPFRGDGKGLGYVFGAIVAPVTVQELVDHPERPILNPTVYAPSTPDLTGIRTSKGEFVDADLEARLNTGELTGRVVDHWKTLTPGKRTIVFAVTRVHSRALVERFVAAGISAEHVEANSPDRAEIFERLRTGETLVVSNVGIATEGWDLPELEVCVLARPTKSLGLHMQMIGRVMRAFPGKTCTVLDHAGNHHRHGLVTDPIEYSLEDRKRATNPVQTCPDCLMVFRGTVCPRCGITDRAQGSAPIEPPIETDEKLVKFTRAQKEEEYIRLVRYASERRLRIGWARHKYRGAFGVWPSKFKHVEQRYYVCRSHDWRVTSTGAVRCSFCWAHGGSDQGDAGESWSASA